MKCGTDQHLIASIRDFDWPCHKRIAHGAHPVSADEDFLRDGYDCPGVLAHPAVMIGRIVKP